MRIFENPTAILSSIGKLLHDGVVRVGGCYLIDGASPRINDFLLLEGAAEPEQLDDDVPIRVQGRVLALGEDPDVGLELDARLLEDLDEQGFGDRSGEEGGLKAGQWVALEVEEPSVEGLARAEAVLDEGEGEQLEDVGLQAGLEGEGGGGGGRGLPDAGKVVLGGLLLADGPVLGGGGGGGREGREVLGLEEIAKAGELVGVVGDGGLVDGQEVVGEGGDLEAPAGADDVIGDGGEEGEGELGPEEADVVELLAPEVVAGGEAVEEVVPGADVELVLEEVLAEDDPAAVDEQRKVGEVGDELSLGALGEE